MDKQREYKTSTVVIVSIITFIICFVIGFLISFLIRCKIAEYESIERGQDIVCYFDNPHCIGKFK